MKLKFHNKSINQYTEINRYFLIPKKMADEFPEGEIEFKVDGKKIKTRIYDVFCDCRKEKHTHKIIDMRDHADGLNLENGQEVEITK